MTHEVCLPHTLQDMFFRQWIGVQDIYATSLILVFTYQKRTVFSILDPSCACFYDKKTVVCQLF